MSSPFRFRPRFDPSKYRWIPVQKQQQQQQHEQEEVQVQPLNNMVQQKEQDSVKGKYAATNAAVGDIPPHQLRHLISFLEKDNSFLTPWSWDSLASYDGTSGFSTRKKQYLRFQPGSYFVREIFDWQTETLRYNPGTKEI